MEVEEMNWPYGEEIRSQRCGIVIHRGKLRQMMVDVSQLAANDAAKRLLFGALQALGRRDIDRAHRLAEDAIRTDKRTDLIGSFIRNVVRFDNVEAFPGEPGYDEART